MAGGGARQPQPVERLIEALTKLPGIGRRTAERLAFHIVKTPPDEALDLSRAIADVKQKVRSCAVCFNLTDTSPCPICVAPGRDASVILVVEQPKDVIALEQTGMYRGVYHVLAGRLDPLGGVEPGDLTIDRLLRRLDDPSSNCRQTPVREVILGLNPDLEGDSTALYLAEELRRRGTNVTRLARGLPSGSQLEYASTAVLADAIQGRQSMGDDSAG
ncbi:MAG: recombination mediator RecR [Planctomycetota bacterium]|jgi:recombination protein RecR